MALRPSMLFRYGQLLLRFKRRSRALEVFRMVTRENPRHPQAWSCIAFLLAASEEFEPAIDAFESALAADPGLERARRGLEFSLAALKS